MVIPVAGVSCVGVGLIKQNEAALLNAASIFPFIPSLLAGAILAPGLMDIAYRRDDAGKQLT